MPICIFVKRWLRTSDFLKNVRSFALQSSSPSSTIRAQHRCQVRTSSSQGGNFSNRLRRWNNYWRVGLHRGQKQPVLLPFSACSSLTGIQPFQFRSTVVVRIWVLLTFPGMPSYTFVWQKYPPLAAWSTMDNFALTSIFVICYEVSTNCNYHVGFSFSLWETAVACDHGFVGSWTFNGDLLT